MLWSENKNQALSLQSHLSVCVDVSILHCRSALGKHTIITLLRGSKFLKSVSGSSKSLTYPRIYADSIV